MKMPNYIGGLMIKRSGEKRLFMVTQVGRGIFQIIHADGNRWTDIQLSTDKMLQYIKAQGFKIVRMGGFKS